MEYVKKNHINEIFEKCGLRLVGNNAIYDDHLLPEKKDLIYASKSKLDYENFTENYKLDLIQKFLIKKNHFKIIDWKFFFNNPETIDADVKEMLEIIFLSFKIYYENNQFIYSNNGSSNKCVRELTKSKNFIKELSKDFSKEFQVKIIFLPGEQLMPKLKKEIVKLIANKIIELGIFEKIKVELPKLILEDLK